MFDDSVSYHLETTYTPPGDENHSIVILERILAETTYTPSGDEKLKEL